jgi:FKBP-type peptidyl-prolyl cis-trans isomerase 2
MKAILFIVLISLFLLAGCTSIESPTGNFGLDENNLDNNTIDVFLDTNSLGNGVNNLSEFEKVKVGDNVSVHYIGKLEDGSVFDSSQGRDPLTFDVGAGQMIKGFDSGVVGMKIGETKTISIVPAEAYGEYNDSYVQEVPISAFGEVSNIQVGMMVSAGNGAQGTIVAVDENTIKVDFNHKLAGKKLIFDVTIVSINK